MNRRHRFKLILIICVFGLIMIIIFIWATLLKPKTSFHWVMGNDFKHLGYEFLGFNNSVFLSERSTADRNFSMGYYMKEHNCFPDDSDLHEVLDLYFQSCSLEVIFQNRKYNNCS